MFSFLHRIGHMTSSQIIILGFIVAILIGALLLTLPFATNDGKGASFSDALFTATSAACVTGLVVQDTATYWSLPGQIVILIMIQTGGMGVVTVAVLLAIISGRKIGLMQRSTMQESVSAPSPGGIIRFTGFILKTTLLIELIGFFILLPVFTKDFGLSGIWYAVFHSVSAFCNAGFDLMGVYAHYSSLTHYADNPVINIAIMILIITGGLGFLTWQDIRTNHIHIRKYKMQSKVILTVTTLLILFPALFFFFFEFHNLPLDERFWYSLFCSVSPRTAGFNTVNLTEMSESGTLITIILMLIGGSPGSTAGGMKTTTLAVLAVTSFSVFSHKDSPHCFGRRISEDIVKKAAAILMIYLTLFLAGGIFISLHEGIPVLTALYETASAIGTVGLTLGITPELGLSSRLVLISLMFFGRVGGLTLIFAAFSDYHKECAKLPKEKITVG